MNQRTGPIDLKGRKFGNYTVLKRDFGTRKTQWICKCKCGKIKSIRVDKLTSGLRTKCTSCAHTTHGGGGTKLYNVWRGMWRRCTVEKDKMYHRYGGRGISICKKWENFLQFKRWAEANGYAQNLTIDRIDNDGDYKPSNCRWVTRAENNRNKG